MGIEKVRLIQFQDMEFPPGRQVNLVCQEKHVRGGVHIKYHLKYEGYFICMHLIPQSSGAVMQTGIRSLF